MRGTPALDWTADEGEPTVLTLRQLIRRPPSVASAVVRICENPTVLAAAADALGPACPPLICLQGQPSAAALALLRHLYGDGSTFQYHGDFDWGGLRIAGALLRSVPWRPWRYTAADYRRTLTTSDLELPPRLPPAHRRGPPGIPTSPRPSQKQASGSRRSENWTSCCPT